MCAGPLDTFSNRSFSAAIFDRNYRPPSNMRVSLGLGWGIGRGWGARLGGLILRGRHLPSAIDLNLAPAPKFRLSTEENRPVYVNTEEINAANGLIAPVASRRDNALGTVREIQALGQSWSSQITASVNGSLGRTFISLFYTFSKSRILAGGVPVPGAFDPTTDGNPNDLAWADRGFAPRHIFRIILSRRPNSRLSVSAFGSLFSGFNFTPMVGGDINGDTFENDRAFVFDRLTTADSTVARDMETLRRTSPGGVRECLNNQAGHIAKPGSCSTPWSPSVDLRADFYAIGDVNSRRLVLTLTASNVTSGLDYLLHGANRLQGWGQFPNPNASLLNVRGFDAARRTFNYAVNPAFGRPSGGGFLRVPFQLVLQARLTFGSDPRYQPLMRAIQGGKGNTIASARASLVEQIQNAPAIILGLASRDSITLSLTLQQRARLNRAADSLQPEINASVDSLLALVTATALNSAVRRARLQQRAEHARSLVLEALARTREVLTPRQLAQLPAWVVKVPEETELMSPEMQMWISGSGP
jgi:hypothetical protein